MTIPPLNTSTNASDVSLENLAGNRNLSEEQKIAEATRHFEALLVRQILKETQKTVFKSNYTDDSTAAEIYRDLVSNELANSISKSGDLGLARTLERQLTCQSRQASPAGHDRTPNAPPTAPVGTDVARPFERHIAPGPPVRNESHKTAAAHHQ
jgi:Rod binding domain-containing protein